MMTSTAQWVLFLDLAVVIVYALFVGVLALAGRNSDARVVAGFVPDCIVLLKRVLGDSRLPRRYRAIVIAMLGYLALPFNLIPDFIPVAGQFDDAAVVVLTLGAILRGRRTRDDRGALAGSALVAVAHPQAHRPSREVLTRPFEAHRSSAAPTT